MLCLMDFRPIVILSEAKNIYDFKEIFLLRSSQFNVASSSG